MALKRSTSETLEGAIDNVSYHYDVGRDVLYLPIKRHA